MMMPTAVIFGVRIACAPVKEIVNSIVTDHAFSGVRVVHTLNVDHVVNLETNTLFQEAYANSWVNTIDGFPIYACAKIRGLSVDKISGSDLVPLIMSQLQPKTHRPFFIVPTEATGHLLVAKLKVEGFDQISFLTPPFGFENDEAYSRLICETVRRNLTTHLFIGVGAPKSEIWVHKHSHEFDGVYAFCVGAGLDYFCGRLRRAPILMQKLGLEWMWRLAMDPRRLWRRYAIGFVKFFFLAFQSRSR